MLLKTYQFSFESGWDSEPDDSLDSLQTLILCFGSPDQTIVETEIQALSKKFSLSTIVGCSSAGEIYQSDVFDNSISISVIQFEKVIIKSVVQSISSENSSYDAGEKIARDLIDDSLRSVLVLSDGLAVNGTQLISGLTKVLPQSVVITGGLAGDGDRFEKTWVWVNGGMQTEQICAIGLYGESVGIGYGSRGGWDVLGPEREVTKSTANVLYELDGQPALELYKKYLGERAEGLPATGLLFPLALINNEDNIDDTVRTILAVDEEENSITFAGDIPEGSYARLMRANFDRLIDGAASAAELINTTAYKSGPLLSIAISCVGRRLVLGQRTAEEIEAAINGLPDGTKQIGFYSYGEISPLANGRCDLHNQTMTLTLIWENL